MSESAALQLHAPYQRLPWPERQKALRRLGITPRIEGGGRLAEAGGRSVQRIRKKVGNIVYSSGGSPGIPGGIPKSGYLTALDLRSNVQVVTGGTAPVIAASGAYGPLGLINVVIGTQYPFSLPGWHANQWLQAFDPDFSDARVASPVVISSTNGWVNDTRIPLTIDPATEVGCWYTSDDDLNLDLQITGKAASGVFSTVNAATIQGSWDVYAERFNAPPPDMPGGWLQPISFFHETRLYSTQALKNGDTQVYLPRLGDYERVMLVFYTGSNQDATFAPADGLFSALDLIVNDEIRIYDRIDEATLKMEMLRNYRRQLAAGVDVIDFVASAGAGTGYGVSRRDLLPSDPDACHSLYLNITSTSANNNVDVVIERAMDNPYAAKWIDSWQRRQKAASPVRGRAA